MTPAAIKKKLKKALGYLSKANDLLNDETQPLFSFFSIEQDFAFEFINNYLPEFLLLTDIEIRSIEDKGGRPKKSLQSFLIFHLLTIYNHGTKHPIKCYWNESDEVAIGKTFDFTSMIRIVLPQISTMLKISPDNQFICQVVKKLKSRFPDLSKIPSLLNGTET